MSMKTCCYYIHALTGLHMGTGQGTGIIDLPIAREKSTGLPVVPGSGIKGVLREYTRPEDSNDPARKLWQVLFGPEPDDLKDEDGFAGALNYQDSRLLCLPVRSIYGVFAWVSCPFVLNRYRRDMVQVQGEDAEPALPAPPVPASDDQAQTSDEPECNVASTGAGETKIFLEDLTLSADSSRNADVKKYGAKIAGQVFPADSDWQTQFKERFIIISDNLFSFLAETGTEIQARIKIGENRTVARGALWYEENLPAETILWGIMGCDRSRSKLLDKKADELLDEYVDKLLQARELHLQIGGNATVGRGNVRWIMSLTDGNNAAS